MTTLPPLQCPLFKVVYVIAFGVNQLGMMVKGILKDILDEILDLYSHIFL